MTEKINLDQKFAPFDELWRPKVDRGDERPGTQAGQRSRANFLGIARARRRVLFRLKGAVSCRISRPSSRWVPAKVLSCRAASSTGFCADEEAEVLLFEPSGTVNTGNVVDAERTAPTGIVI